LRRAHSDLQATVRELERTNASLRAENAERQRAEAALRQSEKDLQTIIETIPAFVVRYRADGTPDFVNQTLRELVGPGVGHDGMRSAVHPDDLPQNLRDWRAHVAAGEPYENEMRLRRLDGAYRWLRIRRVPLRDANGTIVNWYGAGHDIDDQKRAEAALRESEKSLQTVIDTIPALVMRYRADGTADFMNHTMREFIGPGVVLDGKNSTVHPEDYPRRLRDWRAHVAAGEPYENEMRMRRADGVYRWHRVRRVPLRDANGVIVNWYGVGFDIDDQKCAETALRESEYRLRQIFETVPGLLWSTGPDGEPAYVNQRILHYIGKPFEDFKQGGWGAFIHPDDLPETEKDFSHAIQTGTSHEAVHRLRRADGEYRWHRTRAEPLRDQQGRTIQWYGLSVDIDEAKKAEDRLRRSEAHFAEAQRLSHTGSAVYNETEILYWSEESSRIWGFDPQQGIPSRDAVWQRIHPDDLDRVNANIEYAVREKRSFVNEFRIILLDGTVKHIEATNHPAFSASGELLEIFVTGIDVTERKRAAQALRESEARLAEARRELQQTIDTIPIIVARYSPGGEREFVNAAWKRFTGLSDEAAHSMGLFFSVHPDDVADVKRKSLEALAKGEPLHIETRLRRADGEYRWRAVDCVARRDEDGSISNWYGVSYDIEDRKRAEDALRRSEAYLAEAQRLSVIGSFGWRIPGNVVVWSMETYRIFAVDPATVPTLELVLARTHPEDVERVQQYVERMAQEDRDFDVEHRLLLPNGVVKHLHVRTHRVQFEGGEIEIIGAVRMPCGTRKPSSRMRPASRRSAS
jgi:PAS domain S-box-containing protein